MRILAGSAWDQQRIEAFLAETRLPLRVACNTRRGFPLINSLWFLYESNALWCAIHKDAFFAARLDEDPRCGFELAPNTPPYLGVRGQGKAELIAQRGANMLQRLIDRFLGDRDPRLASWLMARADDELVVRIEPTWLSSWDYGHRMSEQPSD